MHEFAGGGMTARPPAAGAPTIIRLVSRVDGVATRVDGQYVVAYNPRLADGAYALDTTLSVTKARRFLSLAAAIEYARQVCPDPRYDSPGHLNRPLTVY